VSEKHVQDGGACAALGIAERDEQGIEGTGMPILFSRCLGVRCAPSRFHQTASCIDE